MKQRAWAAVLTAALRCAAIPIAAGLGSAATAEGEGAVPTTPAPQTQAAAKSAYENQLICTNAAVVGSHIMKKTCRTRAQADAQRAEAKKMVDDANKNSAVGEPSIAFPLPKPR